MSQKAGQGILLKLNNVHKGLIIASQLLLLCFVCFLLVNGLTDYSDGVFLVQNLSKPVRALLAVSMLVFLLLFYKSAAHFFEKRSDKCLKIIAAVLLLGALLLQLVFLFYYRSSYLFDSAFVTGAASSLAQTGKVAQEAVYYLSSYPNQNAFVVLTACLWKVGTFLGLQGDTMPLLLNSVNLLSIDMAVALFFLIIRALWPGLSQSRRTFLILFMVMNPFLYIGVSYYYTITLSMPWLMLLLYFYVKYLRDPAYHGIGISILFALSAVIGFLIRATTIIPVIAILFCLLVQKRLRKRHLFAVLLAMLCFGLLSYSYERCIGLETEDSAFPTTHWLMMSMTAPGSHNAEDEAYTASFPTRESKSAAVKLRMKQKLEQLGFTGLAELMVSKLKNTWGSGTNGYPLFLENCLHTDKLYRYVYGNHKDFVVLYHQGYYLLLLFWIFYETMQSVKQRLLSMRKKESIARDQIKDSYVFQLTMLGAILFYLLWETGPQYSLPFLFVLMLIAAFGMERSDLEQGEYQKKDVLPASTWTKKAAAVAVFFTELMGVVCILFLALFFVRKADVFTQLPQTDSQPQVLQILANEELEIGDGQCLMQTFTAGQPFNQIVFQWRNPDSESDAVYKITVSGQKAGLFVAENIVADGQPYNGFTQLSFDTVQPVRGEQFTISIRKIDGAKDKNLKFVTYQMGFYDAYPGGKCMINGVEQTKDLLLSVSNVQQKTYTGRKTYAAFAITLLLIFLFFDFCCILKGIQFKKTNLRKGIEGYKK